MAKTNSVKRFIMTNETQRVLSISADEDEVKADKEILAEQRYTKIHVYQHIGTFEVTQPKPIITYKRRQK